MKTLLIKKEGEDHVLEKTQAELILKSVLI